MSNGLTMPRGVAMLLGAQFFSALADNALLVIAIAQLDALHAPAWMTPFLKFFFIASFVVLGLVTGYVADRLPKARVMMITNGLKALGCTLLLTGLHPVAAYGLIGIGAAMYSPAKYGLLLELLPASRLVAANAWFEGLSIAAVILGTGLGGVLISNEFQSLITHVNVFTGFEALQLSTAAVLAVYGMSALTNVFIPESGVQPRIEAQRPAELARSFGTAFMLLLRDPQARVALCVTGLLWGFGAVLQFVIIDWGRIGLDLNLDRASMLPAMVALGAAGGAFFAARTITLDRALSILPAGLLFGPLVMMLLPISSIPLVCVLMAGTGAVAGFFVVPMNAMLQHRGYKLMNAGQSIAVQNFCENASIMLMLALYAGVRGTPLPLEWVITGLCAAVTLALLAIIQHHRSLTARADASTIGEATR
jgi:MFS family permease